MQTIIQVGITHNCENSNSMAGELCPAIGEACSCTTDEATTNCKPGFLSPETYLFSRSEYQFMRFGLGFTLMKDGYYTHELGDSWHGMDWDYDELHFNLGAATTNASTVPAGIQPLPSPGVPLGADDWSLYVDERTAPPGNGTLSSDTKEKPTVESPPSQVRVFGIKMMNCLLKMMNSALN